MARTEAPFPHFASSGKEFTAWLTSMREMHPTGPLVYDKCIGYMRHEDRKKTVPRQYKCSLKDKDGNNVLDDSGKQVLVPIMTGGQEDAEDFDTIKNFLSPKMGPRNIRVGLFHHACLDASYPSGLAFTLEEKDTIKNKLWKHTWVGIIARTVGGPKHSIFMFYDSNTRNWPITEEGEDGALRPKRRKEILNNFQRRLVAVSGRSDQNVYFHDNNIHRGSRESVQHACRFLQSFIEKGDAPINLGVDDDGNMLDERMADFVHLYRA
jgi:hypothetical protein